MSSTEIVTRLYSDDSDAVLEALHNLCGMDETVTINDGSLVQNLLNSTDSLIRERAIFLFGIKYKRADLCGEFARQLATKELSDWTIISALIIAIFAASCEMNIQKVGDNLRRLLDDEDVVNEIGSLIVGFVLVSVGEINQQDFKGFIARGGKPSREELEAARKHLAN